MPRSNPVFRFPSEIKLYLGRIERGEGDRCRAEALDTLKAVTGIREGLNDSEYAAVKVARWSGASWTDIAQALGVTRQAAWERWHEVDDQPRNA